MFLNVYKLFEINRQKNNNYIFAKSLLAIRLVDIKNINLKHIHNLINKISDVDRDNRNNRNNKTDRDNKDNRDDRDNKDNEKSSSHVLENTEFRLYSKINSIKECI
ncbi:hypothetical protein CISG_10377 [Coccidioides immitis RMSCC 3703]|uniref:Uncharacterized protein n=1 Tax=Coccidioides immitis RMSCC 3703 TaxID=454286 RepID=A0A0J8QSR6_COCIT|nr:hypothetical protein CISG_10377 [Coccidioides immitis RMSCC 3703]